MRRLSLGALIGALLAGLLPAASVSASPPADLTAYVYDEAGRLRGAYDATNGVAIYSYDAVGNLTSISRPSPSVHRVLDLIPERGPVGQRVTVLGTGFSYDKTSNSVMFNGTAATVVESTPIGIVVEVPAGASSGVVTVTTGGQPASSSPAGFSVTGASTPTVTGLSPSGVFDVDDTITVTGTGFSTTTSHDDVAIDTMRARVVSVNGSGTSLTAKIPAYSGSGPLRLATPSGVAANTPDVFIRPAYLAAEGVTVSATGRIADGFPVTVPSLAAGEAAMYVFDADAGSRFSLSAPSFSASNYLSMAVITPRTDELVPAVNEVDNGNSTSSLFIDGTTVPTTGTYTVIVRNRDENSSSSFQLNYHDVPADVTETLTVNGTAKTLTTSQPGQAGSLTASVTSGQTLYLNLTATSLTSQSAYVVPVSPTGVRDDSQYYSISKDESVAFTFNRTGTWRFLVDPYRSEFGSATFSLTTTAVYGGLGDPSSVPGDEGDDATARAIADARRWVSPDSEFFRPAEMGIAPTYAPSPWEAIPLLRAPRAETALAGRILKIDGMPLAGATVRVGDSSVTTDDTGRFLVAAAPGQQMVVVDGRTAGPTDRSFGVYKIGVEIAATGTTAMSHTIWMTRLDWSQSVALGSPARDDTVVKNDQVPNLEIHIEAGSVIHDIDGNAVTTVSLTPVPLSRTPFPLPPFGAYVPAYFTVQPAGDFVAGEAKVHYPNYTDLPPGTERAFWNYEWDDGWEPYGAGAVTADGTKVVPDASTHIDHFWGAMFNGGNKGPNKNPKHPNGKKGGDPVDLGTGLLVLDDTDLTLDDTTSISATRVYRQSDDEIRMFGMGTSTPYDMFLWSAEQYKEVDLILADGGSAHFARTSAGTNYDDAVFTSTEAEGPFAKATIAWTSPLNSLVPDVGLPGGSGGWLMTLVDGTVMTFPSYTPLTSITDPNGNTTTIIRNGNQRITRLISPHGRWIDFTYGDSNAVSRACDNIGRCVDYTHDGEGRLTRVQDSLGVRSAYTYAGTGIGSRMTTIRDGKNTLLLTNTYDSSNRVTKQVLPGKATYTFAYKVVGGRITQTKVTDPRGTARTVTFDSNGWDVSDEAASGTRSKLRATTTRNAGGTVASEVDPLGRVDRYAYDARGNVTTYTGNAGSAEQAIFTMTYSVASNRVTASTDPYGRRWSYAYDARGNLVTATDPLSHSTTYTYDTHGAMTTATDSAGGVTTIVNHLGMPVTVTDPDSATEQVGRDAAGRTVRMVDARGLASTQVWDARSRLTATTDPAGASTGYQYDAADNLVRITDARGNAHAMQYDPMGRLVKRTDPLGRSDIYKYDLVGNLSSHTDRRGLVSDYVYDVHNRVVTAKIGAKKGTKKYESTVAYTYDRGGRPTKIVDKTGAVSLTATLGWNLKNQIVRDVGQLGNITYGYDLVGDRTSMTVSGQDQTSYSWDNARRLVSIARGTQTVTYSYDALDRVTAVSMPGGVTTAYEYSAGSLVDRIAHGNGSGTIRDINYDYDPEGLVMRRFSSTGTQYPLSLPAAMSSATYNAADQMTARVQGGSYAMSYDKAGNLVSDGSRTYVWNARDQLTTVKAGRQVLAAFGYDPLGRRDMSKVGTTTTWTRFDGYNPVQERSGPVAKRSSLVANVLTGLELDEILSRTTAAGATNSYLTDIVGSVVGLTDPSGAQVTRYVYDPFGAVTSLGTASTNPYQFNAQPSSTEYLQSKRARMYSPLTGRFLSEDPSGIPWPDGSAYAFAGGDPINYLDPTGYEKDKGKGDKPWWKQLKDLVGLGKKMRDIDKKAKDLSEGKVPKAKTGAEEYKQLHKDVAGKESAESAWNFSSKLRDLYTRASDALSGETGASSGSSGGRSGPPPRQMGRHGGRGPKTFE